VLSAGDWAFVGIGPCRHFSFPLVVVLYAGYLVEELSYDIILLSLGDVYPLLFISDGLMLFFYFV